MKDQQQIDMDATKVCACLMQMGFFFLTLKKIIIDSEM